MKRHLSRLVVYLVIAVTPIGANAVTLEEALQMARKSTPELEESNFDIEKSEADVAAIDGVFDPTLFGSTQYALDKTEAQSTFAGDERKNLGAQLGMRKLYSTGTWAQVSYGYDRTEIEYPAIQPGTPAFAAGNRYNPGITNKIEAQLNQPLLRNFNGKEIELQKEAASVGAKAARNVKRIKEQAVQMEVEQLYIAAIRINQQIKLTNDLIVKSKKFRKLMDQRTKIGRADQVDVATAESGVVAQEGRLLSLQIALDETLTKLSDKLGRSIENFKVGQKNLSKPLLPLPPINTKDELSFARQHRYDLKNLADIRASLSAESQLVSERNRPKLDAFVSATKSGLDEEMGDSTNKLTEKNHSQFAVGLKFEMNLGGTENRYKAIANSAQIRKLDAQEKTILSELQRNLKLAKLAIVSARKQADQAERHVSILKRQESAERKKFLQARTDEIGALRFEIEALSAESGLIDAHYNARSAEANIRFALHAYPSEN